VTSRLTGSLAGRSARNRALIATIGALSVLLPILGVPIAASAQDVPQSRVTLDKSVNQTEVEPGDEFTYELRIGCSGLTVACIDATIVDVLPEGAELVSPPASTPERAVTYDPATRRLEVRYIIPLSSPPNPPGSVGLPDGATRTISYSMRLPLETPLRDGDVLTNQATFSGSNTNVVTDSTDVVVRVPRRVTPVATKAWVDGAAVAQSGEESTIRLGIRNASTTTAEIEELTVADVDADVFDRFDVTRLGPVTRYPEGANQVTIELCQAIGSACPPAAFTTVGPFTGAGPFDAGIPLSGVTGVRYRFSNSAGDLLPLDVTGGQVELGLVLRDTIRSTGAELAPTVRQTITNTAIPSARDRVLGEVAGAPVNATYDILPNIVRIQPSKEFCADLNNDFNCNGQAVEGERSGATMRLSVQNTSGFPVAYLEIEEPDPNVPGAVAAFEAMDVRTIRYNRPTGATSTLITVTCRDGSRGTASPTAPSGTLAVSPTLCPAGVFPATVKVRYAGTAADGAGTIANNAVARLDLTGNLNDAATVGTLTNCAVARADNPVNSSGAAVANACNTLQVREGTSGVGGGVKSSGSTSVIAPGQPLQFELRFRNTGTLPVTNAVLVDPPDPTAADNPFRIVRLLDATVVQAPTPRVLEVYDPQAGSYVPYAAGDAALLERATGLRLRITGTLAAGAEVVLRYRVQLRDEFAGEEGLTFRNCAAIGIGTPNVNSPFCNNNEITVEPGRTGGVINKFFDPAQVVRPFPGQDPATVGRAQLKIAVANRGNLNLDRIIITDVDPDFFDAYDVRGNLRVNLPPGANRVQVDVCTSLGACAAGTFVAGTPTGSLTPGLPAGVTPNQVRGFRVTFTNSSGGFVLTPGQNWPNSGPCRGASFCVDVSPRERLLSDPGTLIPEESENTASAAGRSQQQGPGGTFPFGDAPATIRVNEGTPALGITKDPNSRIAPGQTAPFIIVVENTGTAVIPDLLIEDPIPDDLTYDPNAPGAPPGQGYVISVQVPAGTPQPPQVEFTLVRDPTDPDRVAQLDWRFPGWDFLPGSRVTLEIQVQLAPGTPADRRIVNEARTTSERDGLEFECTREGTKVINGRTYCVADAVIESLEGTSFAGNKWSSGEESLGFLNSITGEVQPIAESTCPRLTRGSNVFTRFPCVALNYPGQGFDFVLRLTNESNNAFAEELRILDTLPVLGDNGVLLTDQARGTEWSSPPRLLTTPVDTSPFSDGGTTRYSTIDTVTTDPCFVDGQPVGCVDDPFSATYPDQRDDITAFETTLDFVGAGLPGGEAAFVEFRVSSPLALEDPTTAPIAWNSFAHEDFLLTFAGKPIALPPTEPIKAGIAILFGRVAVTKEVIDPPPGISLPPFPMQYECTATPEAGEPTVVAAGELSVSEGETVLIPDLLPAGATCEVWEVDANGAVSNALGQENAQSVVVEPELLTQAPAVVRITNEYPRAPLEITKVAEGGGIGLPVEGGGSWGGGPFVIETDCVFPPAGGGRLAGFPRDDTLDAGETLRIEDLPVGSVCTVLETEDGEASEVIITVGEEPPTSEPQAEAPVGEEGQTVTITNRFDVGQLLIRKVITGEGAGEDAEWADRDFVFTIDCTRGELVFPTVTATIDRPEQTQVVVPNLPAGGICEVRETDDGGADGDLPEGGLLVATVEIVASETPGVEVTAENVFTPGFVSLTKVVDGPGAGAAQGLTFLLEVRCQRVGSDDAVDKFFVQRVRLTADETVTLEQPLPVGAQCWAVEVDSGGAASVEISADSPENAVEVTDDVRLIDITAVNTFDEPPPGTEPPPPPGTPPTGATGIGWLVGVALLLVGGGAALWLASTRRRTRGL
jgi:uncharacterized repeat protein (TIGR01451 family)